jgi:DNA-binding transcriptional LysR family regulator
MRLPVNDGTCTVIAVPRATDVRSLLAWDDARLVLALLRAPSLVIAARRLAIDKSTLSRRLEACERVLGTKLFLRTREGIRATTVGERLRPHVERMEAEVLAMASAVVAGDGAIEGTVRIATTEGMATRLVSSGLLELRKQHPALALEILGGNRPVDLTRGEADLAVRVTPTKEAGLKVRVLGKFPIALFAAPSYLRARGIPRNATQLEGHDVLLPSGELDVLPEARWLRSRPGVQVVCSSSSLPALVEASARGFGIVPVTRAWGEGVTGLEHLFTLENIAARPTWLVMRPDVAERAAVRVVADHIIASFRVFAKGR